MREHNDQRATALPRISVIMPVYNAEAYLAGAIESVLAQSFTDFELLIHDDGSTDSSPTILRDYAARDSRIRVSSALNGGVAVALNTMIHRAQGEYIARMDADDICMPERFAKQVAWLDIHPGVAVLGTGCIVIDDEGRRIFYSRPPPRHEEIDRLHLQGLCQIEHPTVMMRADTLRAVDGYDKRFRSAQDIDLWLRIAETSQIANLPDICLEYRVHGNSVSGVRQSEQIQNCRQACAAACARRGVEERFRHRPWRMEDTSQSRRDFYLRYAWQAWGDGFRQTWRHYAWEAVKVAPLSKEAWNALIMGALKRPRA